MICRECAEDLIFLFHLIYVRYKKDLDDLPQVRKLKKKQIALLRRNMRALGTAQSGSKKAGGYEADMMQLLDMEKFSELLTAADAYEDRIRFQFMDYTNVFTVDSARPLYRTVGRKGIQNVKRLRRGYCAAGYIRAGKFRDGDLIGIMHQGKIRYAEIITLDYDCNLYDPDAGDTPGVNAEIMGDKGDQGHCISAGHQVMMVLDENAEGIQKGDWIVTD